MLQRTGLSRGVVAIDFLLATVLTLASRFSFRIMERWARKWSRTGVPAVLLGSMDDLDIALTELEGDRWPELRPVALVDRRAPQTRTRFKGYPLYGGPKALANAMDQTEVDALVVVERTGGAPRKPEWGEGEKPAMHFSTNRNVEVYSLRVETKLTRPGEETDP